jgi:hypothetical protein
MMNYLYTGEFAVLTANMIDLMFAVQKYILQDMKNQTEKFILENTDNTCLLSVLSKCFETPTIFSKCLNVFLDFGKDDSILDLSNNVLKNTLEQPHINCTVAQLENLAFKMA